MLADNGSEQARSLLEDRFGSGDIPESVSVPGRVALIGDHIDYHNLPVLAMAIQRRISIAFRPRTDRSVRAVSAGAYGLRQFGLDDQLAPDPPGDWANYLKAAVAACQNRWKITRGIDAALASDLPPAAGLSSSSALVAGFMMAVLRVNAIEPTIPEMLDILPEAEQFVGTRGGGMDHAAVLASRKGCALRIGFAPLELSVIPIPPGWSFVIAHSLTSAEKSGPARLEYNARRTAGSRALEKLRFPSYLAAINGRSASELISLATRENSLSEEEIRAFVHVVSEGAAVGKAVDALREADAVRFGKLLFASHETLRDQLRVSCPALDRIVEIAAGAGALGARLTGAGFGGCAIVFCKTADRDRVCEELVRRFYAERSDFDRQHHLIPAEPSAGASFA